MNRKPGVETGPEHKNGLVKQLQIAEVISAPL